MANTNWSGSGGIGGNWSRGQGVPESRPARPTVLRAPRAQAAVPTVIQATPPPDYTDIINSLYAQVLGRAADPGGFQNALGFLQGGGSPDALRALFEQSPEYQSRFATPGPPQATPQPQAPGGLPAGPAPVTPRQPVVNYALLASLAERENAARSNAGLYQSGLLDLFNQRTLPDLAAEFAGRGTFYSGESRSAADRARTDVDRQVADSQRQLSLTLADLARQRALASAGVTI